MYKAFKDAEWIWTPDTETENQYAEFVENIIFDGKETILRLSVRGDYTLFVNGQYVSSNQYADFEHYKIYDEISITEYLKHGENRICFLVWYFGKSGMRYNTPLPGLIYEVVTEDGTIAKSGKSTHSRRSKAYASGLAKKVTAQLGYSFTYDSSLEDDWLCSPVDGFDNSVVLPGTQDLSERPTERLCLGKAIVGEVTKTQSSYLVDLGREAVGPALICFYSDKAKNINVSYGEVLDNGHVKRLVGGRDFSFDYVASEGSNKYVNYMLRLACRYIEITCEGEIDIESVSLIPQYYPSEAVEYELCDSLDEKIYELCVNTLKLSMMEHYVDCPWREQCLYAFDSRNQMLTGYTAFKDGNGRYAAANLLLMSKDNRPDNLLAICFPSGEKLAIPSFSLYYIIAVREYLQSIGDKSLGLSVLSKTESILKAFLDNSKDGLICCVKGDNYWNFYDWSEYCSSSFGNSDALPDLMINCIFLLALESYEWICDYLGARKFIDCDIIKAEIREKARRFYSAENKCFVVIDNAEKPTELVNALAVLSGVATHEEATAICERLANGEFIDCSLSMKVFKYDALLTVDEEKYRNAVLSEIRRTYKLMLDEGSTTAWECIDGAKAFANAGSLCHGWSAIPIHYYERLSLLKRKK